MVIAETIIVAAVEAGLVTRAVGAIGICKGEEMATVEAFIVAGTVLGFIGLRRMFASKLVRFLTATMMMGFFS